MVFIFRMASILSVVRAPCPAQRPDCCWTSMSMNRFMLLRMIVPKEFGVRVLPEDHTKTRANWRARTLAESTTNVVLFEQGLVTRLVLPLDVIEQGTACCDHFQKTPARMIVLHVGFEVPGEVVDAFRQDRNLNLGRAG